MQMCVYFDGPEDAPFLIVGNRAVGWRKEWMLEMALTNCATLAAYLHSTIEPELTEEQRVILQAVSLDEIVVAFNDYRIELADQESDNSL